MAALGSVFVDVIADVSQFESDLAGAVENALDKSKFAGALATAAAAGVAAVIKEFAPLERELLKVFQVQGVQATDALFNNLADQVLDLSSEVGIAAEDVGSAIAQGIARGFSQEESTQLAGIGSDLAIGLGEDLVPAVQAISGVVNAFGEDLVSLEDAAGGLFQISNLTGTSLKELAQQIGNAAPDAAAAGISFQEMGAAISTMTQSGQTAAEATTQLRTLINALSDSGSQGGKVFKEIAGVTFPEYIKQGHSLAQAVGLIKKASDETGYSTRTLTGDINSNRAVLSLTGASWERYAQNMEQVKGGTEDLGVAVEDANSGFLRQLQIALNSVETGLARVGVALRPLTQALGAELGSAAAAAGDTLADIGDWIQRTDWTPLIGGVERVGETFGRVFTSVGHLVEQVFGIIQGIDWGTVGLAIAGAIGPVLLTLDGFAKVIELVADAIEKARPVLEPLINTILMLFAALSPVVGTLAAVALGIYGVMAAATAIGAVIGAVTAAVGGLSTAWGVLTAMWAASGIGTVIVLVAALTAGIIYLWKNSETARIFITGFLNGMKDTAVTAVQVILNSFLYLAKGVVTGIREIVGAWRWAPDWMGGGKSQDAYDAVNTIVQNIDTMIQGVNNLASAARNADLALQRMNESAMQGPGLTGVDADRIRMLQDARRAREAVGNITLPKVGGPNTGGLGDILGDKKNAAKQAADKAKQITDRLNDMLKGIFESAQKLVKDIGEKSLSEIQSGFEGLTKQYNDAIEYASENGRKTVAKNLRASLKDVTSFQKKISKVANQLNAEDTGVRAQLDVARQALKDLTDESDNFEASMRAAFINIGSVGEASAGIGVTFRGMRNNLKDAIDTTRLFSTAVKQLKALGLNDTSLRQLAEAGPDALDQARALARSGQAGVNEINKLQAELDKLATKNADQVTDKLFDAGIDMAKGIVKGLQSQEAALVGIMESLANKMVNAMKKELKIKSPSGVFEDEVGRMIPAGAAQGVRNGIPQLISAIQDMSAASTASATTFGAGSVQVNGVSDPNAAYRAGILAGEGIKAVLDSQKTSSKLAGL